MRGDKLHFFSLLAALVAIVVSSSLASAYAFNRTKELEIAKTIGDNEVNGESDTRSCILVQSTNGTIVGTEMNENGTMEQVSDQSCSIGHTYRTSDNSPEMIKKYEDQVRERTLHNSRISLYNAFGSNK
jgi:hypothetical protein